MSTEVPCTWVGFRELNHSSSSRLDGGSKLGSEFVSRFSLSAAWECARFNKVSTFRAVESILAWSSSSDFEMDPRAKEVANMAEITASGKDGVSLEVRSP